MGTVELTGFEMMSTHASGQWRATPSASVATMPALMLKRSSRVMPGLRGTPVHAREGEGEGAEAARLQAC